ncbi:MAG: NAD(P)H-binding protein [Actinomycetota bacterium]
MKIVVAGGTGFLGRHISRALMDDGHEVTVLTRAPDEMSRIPELEGASAARADVLEARTLSGVFTDAQGVVGAVQFPNHPVEVPRKGLTYDRFDRQGTEHLLAEAKQSRIERYVYISGAGADPASDKTWYRAKGRAEGAIEHSGLTYSILRPSWAYGPEDRALNRLAAISRFSPVVPRLGMRPQRIQPVFVDDIALAVRRIFASPDAWGRVFEIGGPDVLTMDEIIRTMLGVLGRRRLVVPIPTALAKLGTAPLILLPAPPMTPHGIDFAVQDGLVDTTDLEKVLDVHPIPLGEGLARYMR